MREKFKLRECCVKEDVIDTVARTAKLSREIARFILSKGIAPEEVGEYLQSETRHNPYLLSNMDVAVKEILAVRDRKGRIIVYGDYDADGISASALLKLYFDDIGINAEIILPDRDEGYGLHFDLVEKAYYKKPFDLLITVDCGIKDIDEIALIQSELGVTIVVTDHHELPQTLPNCISVNCKMGYPFRYLSGSGVALKLVQAIGGDAAYNEYACLALIGTIADIMPLVDENRHIVKVGLANINHEGLKGLLELSKCKPPYTAEDIAMRVAPRLNAAGRIETPESALSVLLHKNKPDNKGVERLNEINLRRIDELQKSVKIADELVQESAGRAIIVEYDDFKQGIIGLIASRLKEKYGLPSFVLCKKNQSYVGSARSVEGVNVLKLLEGADDCLERFGGHEKSAGFTVKADMLERFTQSILEQAEVFGESDGTQYYDFEYNKDMRDEEFLNALSALEPLMPNEKPVFYSKCGVVGADLFGQNKSHLQLVTDSGIKLKGFNEYAEYLDALRNGAECEFMYTTEFDSYDNCIVGIIGDLNILNGLRFEGIYAKNYLESFIENCVSATDDKEKPFGMHNAEADLDNLLKAKNIVLVFNSYAEYENACRNYASLSDFYVDFFRCGKGGRRVLIAPLSRQTYGAPCYDFYGYGDGNRDNYLVRSEIPPFLRALGISRSLCVKVYKAITKGEKAYSLSDLYEKVGLNDIKYEAFACAVCIFVQLALIKIEKPFNVIVENTHNPLSNSLLYKACCNEGSEEA
ncbi:MAG: DHH family phosphoesterase [Clostridia bacterium]|nr:DHH family phosphoesterase [Clostridia bacterium]